MLTAQFNSYILFVHIGVCIFIQCSNNNKEETSSLLTSLSQQSYLLFFCTSFKAKKINQPGKHGQCIVSVSNLWTIVIFPFTHLCSPNTFLPISSEHSSRCINMKLGQWHPVPCGPFQPDWNWMAGEAWMRRRTHCRRLIKCSIVGNVGRLACFGLPIVISLLVWLEHCWVFQVLFLGSKPGHRAVWLKDVEAHVKSC